MVTSIRSSGIFPREHLGEPAEHHRAADDQRQCPQRDGEPQDDEDRLRWQHRESGKLDLHARGDRVRGDPQTTATSESGRWAGSASAPRATATKPVRAFP